MRLLSTTLILIALAAGSAAAQQGTFRYAAEPFVAQQVGSADVETVASEGQDAGESYDTFDSSSTQSLLLKKAMHKAGQRQQRIDSRKWFGYSQSRPTVNANPYMSYTPFWVGRTWRQSHTWSGRVWY